MADYLYDVAFFYFGSLRFGYRGRGMLRMQAQMEFLFQACRPASSYMPMHAHTCYELVYYGAGEGTTCIREKTHGYSQGAYAVIPAGTLHDERRHIDTDVVCVGFRLTGQCAQPREGLFADGPDQAIGQLLLKMLEEMQEQRAYYNDQLNHLIGMIVIDHQRRYMDNASNPAADSLLYARAYIDEHFNQKVTVEELAEMVGYSYHHFRHLFRRAFGVSPMAYLLRKRIERASHLLLHGAMTVTAIAAECGFASDAQFSTLFKRECGEPPRSFRAKRLSRTSEGRPSP